MALERHSSAAAAAAEPGRLLHAARRAGRGANFYGLGTLLALLGLWELLIATGAVTLDFMAAPSEIAGSIVDLASSGELSKNLLHTLSAVAIGWSIAVVAGVLLGTLTGSSSTARTYGMATVDMLRALPTIALVPPAVLVFGFALQMEIAVVVYACIWPVVINTAGGIMRVPHELRDVARTFHMGPLRTAFTVVLPAALPAVIVGARLAMSLALILAVVAEMVGNPTGLGYGLVFAQQAINPSEMFAYVVIIGLLGVALNFALSAASRLLPAVRASIAERERR
jgi:ABC-type nitrate/sulfonate/bicarbonate transport system permease component